MLWMKIDTDIHKDDKIEQLFMETGNKGVLAYFILLFTLGEKYEGDPQKPLQILLNPLQKHLKMYNKSLTNWLQIASNIFKFDYKVETNGYFIEIHYPKFLEKQQKYFAPLGKKGFQKPTHIDVEVDIDKEIDKEEDTDKERIDKKENLPFKLQEILELFNSICTDLPKTQSLGKTRESHVKARSKELKTKEGWRAFFERVQTSNWLCGRDPKSNGWHASFDWILKESNFIKILEGNYDNKKPVASRTDPVSVEAHNAEIYKRQEEANEEWEKLKRERTAKD